MKKTNDLEKWTDNKIESAEHRLLKIIGGMSVPDIRKAKEERTICQIEKGSNEKICVGEDYRYIFRDGGFAFVVGPVLCVYHRDGGDIMVWPWGVFHCSQVPYDSFEEAIITSHSYAPIDLIDKKEAQYEERQKRKREKRLGVYLQDDQS
jgi:hypothetical protein